MYSRKRTGSRGLLQWAVDLQPRLCRLFMEKVAQVAA